jgi:predicted HTH transcriptional regulator
LLFESPGGFPSGITVENILTRQSPRNNLIANIFQLSGLVERAGQGMNLIYEQAIKDAKPFPDLTDSDAYFVRLVLECQVYNQFMLSYMKALDEEVLDVLTHDDYYLIRVFFIRTLKDKIHLSRFDHLVELGLVNYTKRGIELINYGRTLLTDENDYHIVENTWNKKIDIAKEVVIATQSQPNRNSIATQSIEEAIGKRLTSDRKINIVSYIIEHGSATSSQLSEFTGLTQARLRVILKELDDDGFIKKIGNYRYTKYILASEATIEY